jgi:hypothetical protein
MPAWAQRSARQVPGEEALDAADKICAVRGDRLENRLGSRLPRPVQQELAGWGQHAEGHGARVPVEPPVTGVRRGVEAPEVASASSRGLPSPSIPCGRRRRGPQEGSTACRRPPIAPARACLRLSAAPEAWR